MAEIFETSEIVKRAQVTSNRTEMSEVKSVREKSSNVKGMLFFCNEFNMAIGVQWLVISEHPTTLHRFP